ncbi:MAG: CBS domain-containing protein [Gemmatales bacterium]|nr:CBS domain-containing protein [Gemmatales bacterium]MCS7160643.1 CBS domain-containing protein [Gemmatales bacterium]MDW8175844.1 CBS domain-containing protein [Gemmatales bacterium]MDW8222023.1 CBS domain-containing protein [Gemmatales bacterium]
MARGTHRNVSSRIYLLAEKAADLMHENPVSIHENATIKEAAAILLDRGISAAPVINEAGRPVGVISRSDIVLYERERGERLPPPAEYFAEDTVDVATGRSVPVGFHVEYPDTTTVREIMTPVVYAVSPDTPALQVIQEMLHRHVHRLFVLDQSGVLIGVISTMDILRRLRQEVPETHQPYEAK